VAGNPKKGEVKDIRLDNGRFCLKKGIAALGSLINLFIETTLDYYFNIIQMH
jgi:hypothetical protein